MIRAFHGTGGGQTEWLGLDAVAKIIAEAPSQRRNAGRWEVVDAETGVSLFSPMENPHLIPLPPKLARIESLPR